MQAVAWLVRPISDPFVRGREFFDVTVVLLTLFSLAGDAGHRVPGGALAAAGPRSASRWRPG